MRLPRLRPASRAAPPPEVSPQWRVEVSVGGVATLFLLVLIARLFARRARSGSIRRRSSVAQASVERPATSGAAAVAPRLDQRRTPYVYALRTASARVRAPFFLAGHKLGARLPASARALLGRAARYDLPELPELGNLLAPSGPLAEAQALAADAFGARRTWFLAHGSSGGVMAAVLACVRLSGRRRVLLPRTAHTSAVHALVHAGATPVWLTPELDPSTGLLLGVDVPTTLARALEAHGADAACVLLVSPTREGALGDIGAAAAACEAAGVPLVVDEAHGAHLGRAPGLPPPALAHGAQLVVQSTHTCLGALSQAAMLHAAEGGACGARWGEAALDAALSEALELLTSSPPSALLLASLDAARAQVATTGPNGAGAPELRRALALAASAREAVRRHPSAYPPLVEPACPAPGCAALDPLRLTFAAAAPPLCAHAAPSGYDGDGGYGGYALDEYLVEQHGVYCALATRAHVTFALGPGSTRAHARRLLRALRRAVADAARPLAGGSAAAAAASGGEASGGPGAAAAGGLHVMAWAGAVPSGSAASPRDACYAPSEAVPAAAAVGRTCAELICAYPPGIPVLVPGEQVRAEALALLGAVLERGGEVTARDPSLETLRVVVTHTAHRTEAAGPGVTSGHRPVRYGSP